MTNPKGRFGIHGGQYIPETLMNAVIELEKAYDHYKNDPEFNRELTALFNDYAGRPSRLYLPLLYRAASLLCGLNFRLSWHGIRYFGSL